MAEEAAKETATAAAAAAAAEGMSFGGFVSAVAMIIAPPLPFLAQYRQMQTTRSSKGFSRAGPLLLLASNALRLAFWFGKRYSLVLVIQSLVLIAVQLALLHLSVVVNSESHEKKRSSKPDESFMNMLSNILEWDDFMHYFMAFSVFSVSAVIIGLLFQNVSFIVELIGVVSVLAEAMLAVPQILQNYREKSVEGVSPIMVGGWFLGDGFKTVYFIATGAPGQFVLCGLWQLCCDICLSVQFYMYRKPTFEPIP